jgi:hypothetical protein
MTPFFGPTDTKIPFPSDRYVKVRNVVSWGMERPGRASHGMLIKQGG